VSFSATGSGNIVLGGTAITSCEYFVAEDFSWNIQTVAVKDVVFKWDVGNQNLHYYTVEGKCQTPPTCEITGVELGDGTCGSGGARFSQTIAAFDLPDLCEKLKELFLNYPVKWPINKIRRHSRPVYLSGVDIAPSNTTFIGKLSDGSTVEYIDENGEISVVRTKSGSSTTTIQPPETDTKITTILPDGTTIQSVFENGVLVKEIITKPDGSVTYVNSNDMFVLGTDGVQDITLSLRIQRQLAGLDVNCNRIEDQEFCHIPECFEFCVDEDHMVFIGSNTVCQDQNSFFTHQMSGGLNVTGLAVIAANTNTLPQGGFSLAGEAICISSNYTHVAIGGLELAGQNLMSRWQYVLNGGILLSGTSEISSSVYRYSTNANLSISGQSLDKVSLRYVASANVTLAGNSPLVGYCHYQTETFGGLTLGGNNTIVANRYFVVSSGGLSLSSQSSPISSAYTYASNSGLVLGGVARIKRRIETDGGFELGGSAVTISKLGLIPSSGFIFSGSVLVGSSTNWSYNSNGSLLLSGAADANGSNISMGTLTTQISSVAELLIFEPVFPVFASPSMPTFSGDTGSVNGNCGCNPTPIALKMQHNISSVSTILTDFLLRNNLTLPSNLNLTFNTYDNSWKTGFHFKGVGSNVPIEDWHTIFKWECSSVLAGESSETNYWKLSILISRIKRTTPAEKMETRILYAFQPQEACDNNRINFTFSIDTNTGAVVLPKTLIASESILNDEIGLFDGKTWQKNPKIKIIVSESEIQSDSRSQDIFSIFPK